MDLLPPNELLLAARSPAKPSNPVLDEGLYADEIEKARGVRVRERADAKVTTKKVEGEWDEQLDVPCC